MFIIELVDGYDPMYVTGFNNTHAVPDATPDRDKAKRYTEAEVVEFTARYLPGWNFKVIPA